VAGTSLLHYDILGATLALAVALLAIYALHMLALASGRFAQRAFSPSEAVRRLQAAEALAAEERGKAERAEQSRRDLIINVGHELRTPTASILGHVESVLLALDSPDGHVPPETLRTYLGIVQREAERLSSLVDDLLAVARAERAELQLVLAPVDAAEVIHEVYEVLAPLARRERQVMLVEEVEPDLPPLLADRQRLSQVLLNLVRNAITYTPAGGIVSIALRRADAHWLRITVADTGSGIAPEDLPRVFERFYRADASRARESGGFGLGLAIARDLVEAMGGTISAESIVGEGSAFHVTLPIAMDDH
jgi:signal transduction histidine kinase